MKTQQKCQILYLLPFASFTLGHANISYYIPNLILPFLHIPSTRSQVH